MCKSFSISQIDKKITFGFSKFFFKYSLTEYFVLGNTAAGIKPLVFSLSQERYLLLISLKVNGLK